MDNLPVELLLYIFDYTPNDIIAISQVNRYLNTIVTTQMRKMVINFHRENEKEIETVSRQLGKFKALKHLKVKLCYDVNISEKADFCAKFSNKIHHLTLSDFSFLNPFFDKIHVIYDNLDTLIIENSDLTSSTDDLPDFILKSCINLKNLKMSGCSGLEIDSLNRIGRELSNTKIEKLALHPTYSYFDMSNTNDRDENWTIENLRTLSIRSKLVVMKKNFVRNMLGSNTRSTKTFPNLNKLELIADLNFGSNFVTEIISQFPNLECLAIGKGVKDVRNQDFSVICNHYKALTSLEFHFINHNEQLDLRHLHKNYKIQKLTIGLTEKLATKGNLQRISDCLPNLKQICVVLYYLIPSNQQFLEQLVKIFSKVKKIYFTHIGMNDKIRIML